jgi:hypothetical protein
LRPSNDVKRLIEAGYIPDLTEWPPSSECKNNRSARDPKLRPWLLAELKKLEENGAIERISYKPWIVSPLQIVERKGKSPRLVFDVSRSINPYIDCESVKLDGLEKLNEGACKGDYFSTTDLRSGYHHIKIAEDYRDLFGFRFHNEAGKEVYYRWSCAMLGA